MPLVVLDNWKAMPRVQFKLLNKLYELQIHGVTGVKITNAQILKQAILLARKLESEGMRGKVVMVAMASDHTMVAVYLALLFAGVVPLFTNANSTICKWNGEMVWVHHLIYYPITAFKSYYCGNQMP